MLFESDMRYSILYLDIWWWNWKIIEIRINELAFIIETISLMIQWIDFFLNEVNWEYIHVVCSNPTTGQFEE